MKRTITCVSSLLLVGTAVPASLVVGSDGIQETPKPGTEDLVIQLAEARCNLARAQFKLSQAEGDSPSLTDVYRDAVEGLDSELATLKAGKRQDSYDRLLTELQYLARIAAVRLKQATAASAKAPGNQDKLEIALLQAKYDILQLGAAQGELLRSASRERQIEWQLEQLGSIQLLHAEYMLQHGG